MMKIKYIYIYCFYTGGVVQTKTSPFSTRRFILVNYKVLSQLYQPIPPFSYLNSAQHNLVIELCCD